ncbi:MAG TPA: 23S rRNA (adenine(2503)-C(2))-methyltransferase RlmN [bacterium]|nr:23S rRNA (adenine(2503)-C(2))-methyltransferase RlmN [bacterium]
MENKRKDWIFDKSQKELEKYCITSGFKKYGATQIMKWIYRRKTFDFAEMTDLSESLRKKLANNFCAETPKIVDTKYEEDSDGYSKKYLIKLSDGETIESVLINYRNRKTLCVSSQIGCKMGCVYCETSGLGFIRNLTSGEIISQILVIEDDIENKITNIVFMGMGEPLDNIAEVEKSLDIISNANFIAVAPRKITISTCGVLSTLPNIENHKYKIAISLNAADNITRSKIMPINKKFPIENIVKLINDRKPSIHNKITIEYVLIKDINDHIGNTKKLIKMFSPSKVKFNLIPLNKEKKSIYLKNFETSDDKTIADFKSKLFKAGFTVTIRFSKAQSVNGGCGQLKAEKIYSQ